MQLQAVVFDMDGVLIDTEPLWAVSMLEVAHSYGIEMTLERLRFTTGLKINEVTAYWKDKFGWSHHITSQELAEVILDHIIDNAKQNAGLMYGIQEHLDYLKSSSIKIAVATSSPNRMMNQLIKHFGIYEYFDVLRSAEHCKYGKPHPQVYLDALYELNAVPYCSIAIEDSINGVVAAKAARMKVIAIPEKEKIHHKAFGIADRILDRLPNDNFSIYQEVLSS